ncbi:MAG: hypothetical protein ABIU58_05640 [Ramlibacter sp.]
MSTQRHIAVTVEETGLNEYVWVLTESTEGHASVLKNGEHCRSYMEALDAGHEALALLLTRSESHDAL